MKCELCSGEIDWYALENESGYCTNCTKPEGSLFEVLNYFKFPLQTDPFEFFDEEAGKMIFIRWPDKKNPALWHMQACKLFPGWDTVVETFKKYHNIRLFDIDALRDLIQFLKDRGMTPEEIAIMRRDQVVKMIRAESSSVLVESLLNVQQVELPRNESIVEQILLRKTQ